MKIRVGIPGQQFTGAPGKSAYQVWLDSGNTGTLTEFLESLRGEDGQGLRILDTLASTSELPATAEPGDGYVISGFLYVYGEDGEYNNVGKIQGPPGESGEDGTNGLSAYQLAQQQGYGGTLTQWLATLKGEQGVQGQPGAKGETGSTGQAGSAGMQGPPGTNGRTIHSGTTTPASGLGQDGDLYINTSASTYYVKSGTWGAAKSLIGPQGVQGNQGIQGIQGESFNVDDTGTLQERAAHDTKPTGYSYLATDVGSLYIKQSAASGDWSEPIPFGQGPPGPGLPAGGTTGQYPRKTSAADYQTEWATLPSTYPPTDGSVTNAKVATNAGIQESKLSLASDAAPATPSRRTLGTGATQAAAGNDSRLSDARTPTVHAHDDRYYTEAEANTLLSGKADLVGGSVPTSQLPALAINDTFTVNTQTAMLALNAQRGDMAIRTDQSRTYVLAAEPASTLANWLQLPTPPDAVVSVNGQNGIVNLSAADVSAKPSSYVPAYSEVTGKPATFPPEIGSGAAQAVAGNDPRLTDARTPTTHNHDDRYYTESEIGTLLAGKSDYTHLHDSRYVRTVNGAGPDGNGNVAVAGGGSSDKSFVPVFFSSILNVRRGEADIPTPPALAGTYTKFRYALRVASTGSSVIVAVYKGRSTTASATATIPAGSLNGEATLSANVVLVAGDVVTFGLTQVGSSVLGSSLTGMLA